MCIILGPPHIKEPLNAMGRVLGALMSDQVMPINSIYIHLNLPILISSKY